MLATTVLGTAVLAVGRAGAAILPPRLRKKLEDRFFFAVFNLTRVTNDAYGWRPRDDDQRSG
ncbi:MAG: hypothetical protein GXP62_07965 [Oligoflexia bacterium]|nr:hypothetical protein [Oligoflexia bacterium]